MKRTTVLMLASIGMMTSAIAQADPAPVAGSTVLGVTVVELRQVALGWSTKREVIGKGVFNSMDEKIGVIDDVIFSPNTTASFAIIGVGGFLDMGKREVAIPVPQIALIDGKFMLNGATKEALKALPAFVYAQ